MNAHNTQTNYMATSHAQSSTYATPAEEPESCANTGYFLSLRGILKLACLVSCFIAFLCLVATEQCGRNHVFLATVTWLVILMQVTIIVVFVFRLQSKFSGIDFDFLDFFATSHDALYLLIASSVTVNYCPNAGQVAGAIFGFLAFVSLVGSAVTIFLARREESPEKTNSSGGR